jgi:cell pole-organizing protein PopZ
MVSSPQHEPTMEEILASIRKIISEDSTEQQAAPAEAKSAPVAPPPMEAVDGEADILELTQEVQEEPPVMAAPEPVRQAPPPPPPPLPEQDVVFEPIDPPAPQEAPVASGDGIFSDKTRQAVDDAFASIEPEEGTDTRSYTPSAMPMDGLSVEAVFERAVRDAFEPVVKQWLGDNAEAIVDRMKPLIREWMDEHFPALLEGAVRDEVARVARARGTKR